MNKINWLFLLIAIISETIATTALKAINGFTNIIPLVITVAGYVTAFFFLSLVLKGIPVAIAYAIWSGLGIVLIALISRLYYKQTLDIPAIMGIMFIIAGVVIMNVFSKNIRH
jgi:small multidrug resistance pump